MTLYCLIQVCITEFSDIPCALGLVKYTIYYPWYVILVTELGNRVSLGSRIIRIEAYLHLKRNPWLIT